MNSHICALWEVIICCLCSELDQLNAPVVILRLTVLSQERHHPQSLQRIRVSTLISFS